jgi:peptide/nickel transport system substrate-binding protein
VMAPREAPSIPLGQFFIRTVFRGSITGLSQGPCPYPWNIRLV